MALSSAESQQSIEDNPINQSVEIWRKSEIEFDLNTQPTKRDVLMTKLSYSSSLNKEVCPYDFFKKKIENLTKSPSNTLQESLNDKFYDDDESTIQSLTFSSESFKTTMLPASILSSEEGEKEEKQERDEAKVKGDEDEGQERDENNEEEDEVKEEEQGRDDNKIEAEEEQQEIDGKKEEDEVGGQQRQENEETKAKVGKRQGEEEEEEEEEEEKEEAQREEIEKAKNIKREISVLNIIKNHRIYEQHRCSSELEIEDEPLSYKNRQTRKSSMETMLKDYYANEYYIGNKEFEKFLRQSALTKEEREIYENEYLLKDSLKLNNNGNWDKTQGDLLYCKINSGAILSDKENPSLELLHQKLIKEENRELFTNTLKQERNDSIDSLLKLDEFEKDDKLAKYSEKNELNNIFTEKNAKYVDFLLLCMNSEQSERFSIEASPSLENPSLNGKNSEKRERDNTIVNKSYSIPDATNTNTPLKREYNCILTDDIVQQYKINGNRELKPQKLNVKSEIKLLNSGNKSTVDKHLVKTLSDRSQLNQELINWCNKELKKYKSIKLIDKKLEDKNNDKNVCKRHINRLKKDSKWWPVCSKYPKFKIDHLNKEKLSNVSSCSGLESITSILNRNKPRKINNSSSTSKTKISMKKKKKEIKITGKVQHSEIDCISSSESKRVSGSVVCELGTGSRDESTLNNRTIKQSGEKNQTFNKFSGEKVKSMTKKTKPKMKMETTFEKQSPKSTQIGQGKRAPKSTHIDKSSASSYRTISFDLQEVKLKGRPNKFSSISSADLFKCQTNILRKKRKRTCTYKGKVEYPTSTPTLTSFLPSTEPHTLSYSDSMVTNGNASRREIDILASSTHIGPGIPIKKEEVEKYDSRRSIPFGILNSPSPGQIDLVKDWECSNTIESIQDENVPKVNDKSWRNKNNWDKVKLGFIGNESINNILISIFNEDSFDVTNSFVNSSNDTFSDNYDDIVENSDVILITYQSVKSSKDVLSVLKRLSRKLRGKMLLIILNSIQCNICIDEIENILDNQGIILKILINLTILVKTGIAICVAGRDVLLEDLDFVSRLFKTIGLVEIIKEEELEAVYSITQNGLVIVRGKLMI
ncbi:DgyrCDS8913 [Dimorphilus gyrociliatus]|uniref:DgyrCDS8913 n=1 Tax=Dimorphilus gyrociliatus TaxID=2664684 RepID=A0A7I8VWQ9_9ANNE|nr:DgyrCDS8913 [Dimorphilus gyrociliatus]